MHEIHAAEKAAFEASLFRAQIYFGSAARTAVKIAAAGVPVRSCGFGATPEWKKYRSVRCERPNPDR